MSDDFQATVLAVLHQLRVDISGLQAGQESLRAEVADLRVEVASLRTAQDSIRSSLSHIQIDLETLRSFIVGVSSETNTLRIDLMSRMDRIQDVAKEVRRALELIREGIGVNYARADRVEVKSDAAAEVARTLTAEVVVLQRQIKRLEVDVRTLMGTP